jgi:hypothetical protein
MDCLAEYQLDEIADALVTTGYLVIDDFLPEPKNRSSPHPPPKLA